MYQTYRIFTDGSAIGNPGPGGWGVVRDPGTETLGDVRRISLDDHLGNGTGRPQFRRFGRCPTERRSNCTQIRNT